MQIKVKYRWSNLLPFIRLLVIILAFAYGGVLVVKYLADRPLVIDRGPVLVVSVVLALQLLPRRADMRIRGVPNPARFEELLQPFILKLNYHASETEGRYLPNQKKVMGYFDDLSIRLIYDQDTLIISGPGKRIRELEDAIRFNDVFGSWRDQK